MILNNSVTFVSAGLEKPKKRDNILARRQQYLNYGALTLATILDVKGYSVKLYHGGHAPPGFFARKLFKDGRLGSCYPLMLSMQSYYALSWVKIFTESVKKISPSTRIVVGGRWVVGPDPIWLKEQLPFVDEIIDGLAEDKVVRIVENENSGHIPISNSSAVEFVLNHRLIDNFNDFQPNVEASRGCGMGCDFCEERDIPLTPLKRPDLLARQLQDVALQYEDNSVRPYVQSSFFAPNKKWSEDFLSASSKNKGKVQWRCETRVDSIKPSSVSALAEGGLKAIDLGLESASPTQILRMKKSKDPERYLRLASDFLHACRDNDIWVKVNFLIYAGENKKTYEESLAWLDEHSDCIKGISVGPVVVFGSPRSAKNYISNIRDAGGELVDPATLQKSGIAHIHPSSEISCDEAEKISLDTSRRYMTKSDYFDLKSFSYYPRSYKYSDFIRDVNQNGADNLPFSVV